MKNFLLIVLTLICFGFAKANMKRNTESLSTQKTFTVYGINVQKSYEVTFKFVPQKRFIYGPPPKAIAFQNKLMTINKSLNDKLDVRWFRLRSTPV